MNIMYVYSDTSSTDQIYGETTTPAHLCEGTNDFGSILEDMLVKGVIPFNTKQAYPTIWKADIEAMQQGQTEQQNLTANVWLNGGKQW
jgi:hypothetical protein